MSDATGPETPEEGVARMEAGHERPYEVSDETLARHLLPLLEVYDVKWHGHGVIYVNDEPYNIETSVRIVADLSKCLGLPADVVRRRLIEARLLKDARKKPLRSNAAQTVVDQLASRTLLSTLASKRLDHEDPDQT
ncbi:hypothetical protein G7009_03895 [Pseudomonas capeferrum]|uniref:hypothetical protein n=1 Tax=Pseudomonas capeferrum TaxID=1495066 RepID=UPI0015E48297|nr:hypothetical protein [Pseudomonas capeferrum]MBA1200924.1 hypothetical protein [Pseudomonas capeferrum]